MEEEAMTQPSEERGHERLLTLVQDFGTSAQALDQIVRDHLDDEKLCRAALRHPHLSSTTLGYMAEHAPPFLAEEIAHDQSLLSRFPEVREALLENPALSEDVKDLLQEEAEEPPAGSEVAGGEPRRDEKQQEKRQDLYRLVKELTPGQKLTLAKKGNKDVRMLLVRDPNELVALEVITSPRITDSEVLHISQMTDVSEKVLRAIANNRKYRSNRQVVISLLHNPKTPVAISLGLGIVRLSDRELSGLAKNRNIPGLVSRTAALLLERRKRTSTAPGKGH